MPHHRSGASAPSTALTVLRVTSGNFLEMFDFFLFGFYAKPIGDTFFPVHDSVSRLLLAFLSFGAAFLMRPAGAIVLGAYVDKVGRRRGLIVTLAIMAAGTLAIAATPGFATFAAITPGLGYVAPLLVLAGRLAQGFSAGVELGGVSVYLAEMARPGRRGFMVAWQSASQQVAIVVAALLGFALERGLGPAAVAAWGWRVPFALGCAIVPVLFWVRRSLVETDAFLARPSPPDLAKALAAVAASWRIVLLGTLLVVMTTVSFYLVTVYTPTFGRQVLHLDPGATLLIACGVGLANFCVLPLMGVLSDQIGRRPLLLAFAGLMLASAYPALSWLAATPTVSKMLAVELWLAFLYAGYNGAMVVALTEIVPPDVRTAGFSLAYSLATALFGGMTPAVSQLLIERTGDKASPGLWLSAAAGLSLAATFALGRTMRAGGAQRPSR